MKKNKIVFGAIAICAAAFPGGSAFAAFYIDPTSPPAAAVVTPAPPTQAATATSVSPPTSSGGQAVIMHQGAEPALVQPAVGMGHNIPLIVALQQIVPSGWYVLPEHGDLSVSWKGSASWVKTLTEMLNPISARAVIDWDKQTVRVYVAPPEPAVTKDMAGESAEPVAPQVESWTIRVEDGLISTTLQRWAEEAQAHGDFWGVSWESPMDFPVMFNATFAGSFESAVTQLVQSLASTEAPVQAIIYENHVVRVVPIGTKIK